jgi:preprotein translocase subunit SecG
MVTTLVVLIAIISAFLIVAVLIQNPKGGGIDSSLGGTAANNMFGAASSADLIVKITWYLAIAVLVLCIVTSVVVGTGGASATEIPLQSIPK